MSVSIKKIFWMIVVNYLEKRQPFLIYMKESFGLVVEHGLWIMDNGRKVSSLWGGQLLLMAISCFSAILCHIKRHSMIEEH